MLRFLPPADLKPFLDKAVGGVYRIESFPGGLLNQNMLVRSGRALFVLKVYRPKLDEEAVAETHRLMTFVAKRGIPVAVPLHTGSVKEHVVALYPYVKGEHPARYNSGPVRIRAMGDMLGRIEATLDDFRPKAPKPTFETFSRCQDAPDFLHRIVELRASLPQYARTVRAEVEPALDTIERIIRTVPWDRVPWARLPVRVCHNDFHTANILMRRSHITGVLDWEKAGWHWRGFEFMRSVVFNCRSSARKLDWDAVDLYARAYLRHTSLTDVERETAFDCGFQELTFSLWAIRQYLAGNKDLRGNVARRTAMLKYLAGNREEFSERIAAALKK